MELTYKGKNAIVTGASGGMGLEISKMLSENNINVLMLDIQSPTKSYLSENINCIYKKVDVTNLRKLKSIMEKYFKKNKSVDYLINTTGVLWFNKDVSAADIKPEVWDKVFNINLKSMMHLSKIIISCPFLEKKSEMLFPKKPLPPVTNTLIKISLSFLLLQFLNLFSH